MSNKVKEWCDICGHTDDKDDQVLHQATPRHMLNKILYEYKEHRKKFTGNRNGIKVSCSVKTSFQEAEDCTKDKIIVSAKSNEVVNFSFNVYNETKAEDIMVVGIQIAHHKRCFGINKFDTNFFNMNDHGMYMGNDPHILKPKSFVPIPIHVTFGPEEIGQYEMPIIFTFQKMINNETLIIIRDMIVCVEEQHLNHIKTGSPYKQEYWNMKNSTHNYKCKTTSSYGNTYKVPKTLKKIFACGMSTQNLELLQLPTAELSELKKICVEVRSTLDEGIIEENYIKFFRHLLWWEEVISRIQLKKYNMTKVSLIKISQKSRPEYSLVVPGLAEKRPSLLRGDIVVIRFNGNEDSIFQGKIKDMDERTITISDISKEFHVMFRSKAEFDVRFTLNRNSFERMQEAVTHIMLKQKCRIFPQANRIIKGIDPITRYYNDCIKDNPEQKSAVEHIVAGTSGKSPYMVFGPPGTGKTITIVEAIIQTVIKNPRSRIMVCTGSNMAADNIACMLLKYNNILNINKLLFRANSQNRVWECMPPELRKFSNGHSYESFYSMDNASISGYKVVVTTLLHAAKYGAAHHQRKHNYTVTHLFIDEAAQALESASLIPISALLAPNGLLVLAGDPQQLGPVCVSKDARNKGLGQSLMERLKLVYPNLYTNNPNYITMLKNNFRSHPDILLIPNQLFYDNSLRAMAPRDPLSNVSILDDKGGKAAIVFHAVSSKEEKDGKSPSFFNTKELEILKMYVKVLIQRHQVEPKDIGVVTPYVKQVYKTRTWLKSVEYGDVEVGTVEAFQGKEKRVILVSTVRANCKLLDYDAKYELGFLVDDKRFNVTLTRAKAKLIIIGNPACLEKDIKWDMYIKKCQELNTYFGVEKEQFVRSVEYLQDVTDRFSRCRVTEALKKCKLTENQKKNISVSN